MAVALSLALTACGGGSSDSSSSGGNLRLGAIVPPTSLSAANAFWANESIYTQAVYDSLLRETPDAQVQPWLATSWSYDDSKTVLTMKLRDDVVFTDGTKFDASVAAQNVLRFKAGTSSSAANLANVSDAVATDPTTLTITLSQPDPAMLLYLAQAAGAQGSPKAFGAPDEQTNPVGSGPYVLDQDKTVVGSTYVYTKNPDYWAPEEQHFDTLTVNVYATIQTEVNALQGGQIDGANLLDNTANDQVEAAGFTLVPHELDWAGLVLFDRSGQLAPQLADVRVRQAIAHAIDREAILEAANDGAGTVTGQVFGPGTPAFDESLDDTYDYDPPAARKLLADAGLAGGFSVSMPQIQIGSTTVYDLVAQYLSDVGITVDYTPVPLNSAIGDILAAKYPAAFFILQQDPTAWQTANFSITQGATWNVFHQADPTVQGLVSTIQSGSEADADAAAKKLNEYVVQQAWFVPFYRNEGNFAASKDIEVVQQADNAYPLLQNITPAS
ncbi:peptide ABC transporter substrate-binding protein [Modestobacter sp. I12A-02628]|uniref:Peptide ABC transporter substrate-binding protein n=1 Tax=Goekera deserti TaxID=2497753 RepID=A0A7K3WGG3_9ACTN|nr:ABC transporter substrate-binding protein [Goekera deserti]MPQ96583.1 peptide ABC transporter substrate-binding protein [Goekera deserti]NDI47105.1 peptide ABC transporter substrate-binding protein [Goekera deserti]NEL55497.1 peptide ABC transporter substrate-binding protein [Goekera deserti]